MNYCVLYCVGGCGSRLTGYSHESEVTEGSADGLFICEDCKGIDVTKLNSFAQFALNEADIINSVGFYINWVKAKDE